MNELFNSYNVLRGTVVRTAIYTVGHFLIAAACVMYFTGASLEVASIDAAVEPLLNGVWYFVLDRIWCNFKANKQTEECQQ